MAPAAAVAAVASRQHHHRCCHRQQQQQFVHREVRAWSKHLGTPWWWQTLAVHRQQLPRACWNSGMLEFRNVLVLQACRGREFKAFLPDPGPSGLRNRYMLYRNGRTGMAEQVWSQCRRGRMLQAPVSQGSRGPWPVRKKQLQRAIPGPNTSVNTASCSAGVSGSGVLRSALAFCHIWQDCSTQVCHPVAGSRLVPWCPCKLAGGC